MRIILPHGALVTSQDFGCTLHQTGYCTANLYPPDEAAQIVADFFNTPRPTKEE